MFSMEWLAADIHRRGARTQVGSTPGGLELESLTVVVVRLQQRCTRRRCEVGLKPELPSWILGFETAALLGVANELEGGWRRARRRQSKEAGQGKDDHAMRASRASADEEGAKNKELAASLARGRGTGVRT